MRTRALNEPPRRLIDRRTLVAGGLCASGLALSGAADFSRAAAAASYGTASVRLGWVPNVEFAGEYIADHGGFFTQEGFAASKLLPGGPSATPVEADLLQNKCLVGISAPDITAAAVAEGGALRIIGAQYQKNAFCIMSLASKPLLGPKDMVGKKIGVAASNQTPWAVLLAANNLDPASVKAVPVQFDPAPLVAGEVDGWVAYVTNEPNVLKVKGVDTATFLFADHGYPLVSNTYTVRASSLQTERDALKAFLRAEIRGWQASLKDPASGAKLAVDTYGRTLGLDLAEQTLQSRSQNALVATSATAKNGLFTMTPDFVAENVAVLKASGLDVSADQLFDMSLIAEVYASDPSLIQG